MRDCGLIARAGTVRLSELGTARVTRWGLLNSAGGFCARRRGRRHHEPQPLEQHDRALRRSAPNELAAFSLAVLNVNIPAGILQAAISEGAMYEHSLIKNHMLVFENLVLVSGHGDAKLTPAADGCKPGAFPASQLPTLQPSSCVRVAPTGLLMNSLSWDGGTFALRLACRHGDLGGRLRQQASPELGSLEGLRVFGDEVGLELAS